MIDSLDLSVNAIGFFPSLISTFLLSAVLLSVLSLVVIACWKLVKICGKAISVVLLRIYSR